MVNMDYYVIDLRHLYKLNKNEMFLVLSRDINGVGTPREIRVSHRRKIQLNYLEDETVRILVKRKDSCIFDSYDVICVNGSYDIYRTLEEIITQPTIRDYSTWQFFKTCFSDYITEYAMFKSCSISSKIYQLIVFNPIKIGGVNMCLHSIDIDGEMFSYDIDVINKILAGERITIDDMVNVVDRYSKTSTIMINFGTLFFDVSMNIVYVSKIVSESERITFDFKKQRVEFVSMFLTFVLKAEAENRLLSSIEEYYI